MAGGTGQVRCDFFSFFTRRRGRRAAPPLHQRPSPRPQRCRMQRLLLALSLLTPPADGGVRIAPPPGDGGAHWPRWRGPTGQGLAVGTGYPDRWSDTDNVLWAVDLPGRGNSSPVIWGERIFLTTSHDQGKRRSVLCLNRA